MIAPITTATDLAAAAATLGGGAAIGIDTEFMRERTYYAQLCLLQMAGNGVALCVDTLALDDLATLRPLMAAAEPCKILHAARQDLEVLAPVVGALNNIFDTQVAAALIGFPAQIGGRAHWHAPAQERDTHRLVAPAPVGGAARVRAR